MLRTSDGSTVMQIGGNARVIQGVSPDTSASVWLCDVFEFGVPYQQINVPRRGRRKERAIR
jgi:hypothetical protein